MSGHSKWAKIKHAKGAADAKKGQAFSKLAKELMVVAKQGGGDPAMNASLRNLIQKAKSVNMPNDNIDRAIKKGTGEIGGAVYEDVSYEGYAAGGVGLIVKALTDNKNRAAAEIRNIFKKNNSDFAALGAVSRGFERKGQIVVDGEKQNEDAVMEIVLNAGADDMVNEDGTFVISASAQSFADVCDALQKAGIQPVSAEVGLFPLTPVLVKDVTAARSVNKFVAALEEHDDVQNVYVNMEVDESIADQVDEEE
jgi:YebC/PmpR family DNA-binding regulatory protein